MNKESYYNEIYKLYGPVTRARNCFLYTKKAKRLTDCFQENGRAILGWDGKNAFTVLKNTLCRAQVGSFTCEDSCRVGKALSSLFLSNRRVFYFSSKRDALQAGLTISAESTSFYIPWSNFSQSKSCMDTDCIVMCPPLPWTDTIYLLAVKEELINDKLNIKSTKLPFALEAAIARSIYNLIAALQEREEKDWFIYDTVLTRYFTRQGPYLIPKIPQEEYDDFILHCLKLGILFNPDWNEKSIVPFNADKGVFTCLKNSPFKYGENKKE